MPDTTYTVRSGDTLWAIGEKFSLPWEKIWNAPQNDQFKKDRGNPNILYPGDELVIPDREQRDESGGTEQKHSFKKPGKARIRIAVLDLDHEPMAGVEFKFVRSSEVLAEGSTGSDGIAELKLAKRAGGISLVLPWGEFPVEVGELDPANTVRGIQQRITNLGIDAGPIDGIYGPLTRAGIVAFQRIEGIDETGEPDEDLIKKLRERHDGETLGNAEKLEKKQPDLAGGNEDGSSGDDDTDEYAYPDAEAFYGNNGLDPFEDLA